MGEVFLAHDRRLATDVAIKRLSPQFASSPELRESIRREAQIMAKLSDASIVRLFDLAEFFGDSYLVLEYVPGPTLRDMIRAGYRATPQELALIMGEISQGLTAAHNAGVIHRDLKPSNLLLALQGSELAAFLATRQIPQNLANAKVKITDFGIAKAIADAHLTVTNAFSGTPGYMAPEQFRGEIPWPQTDVYAMGVITHELLTGGLPTQPIHTIPSVHPAVTDVVRKSLAPSMRDRFPSAAAFYTALYEGIEGRSPVRPIIPAGPTKMSGPKAAVFAVVVAIIVGIAGVALTALTHYSDGRGTNELRQMPEMPKMADRVAVPEFHRPPPFNWRSFPKASEPPPIVEEARGRVAAASLLGPRNPKLKWDVELPEVTSVEIAMAGKDGTVYLTGYQGALIAVRDGKMQWAYKSSEFAADIQEFAMDKDGRIWFKIHTMGGYERYAFNRDGQGGRLPRSFENLGPSADSRRTDYSCWKNRHTLTGPEGDLELDDNCLSVAVGPESRIYVATDGPQILAVSKQGHVESKYNAPCPAARLIPTLPHELVFTCADQTLHALRDTAEIWKRAAEGKLLFTGVDAGGTIYYGDAPETNRDTAKGRVHAIDAQGKDLWTAEIPLPTEGSIAFGAGGQMFVVQRSRGFSESRHVICLSD
jgi:serine/threonine protein kinase/outer membrane protein assembly factor BamB